MSFGRKAIGYLLLLLNLLVAMALLMALVAPYISPGITSVFAFAATGFPILIALNLVFVLIWAFRFSRYIFLSLVLIALSYCALKKMFQFGVPHRVSIEGESLAIMSFNVRNFNRYGWLPAPDIPAKIGELITKAQPDIILFQEYVAKPVPAALLKAYPYRISSEEDPRYKSGLAIYAKFPLMNRSVISLGEGSIPALTAQVTWQNQTINLINVHLASVGFEATDYKTLDRPNYQEADSLQSGITNILKRLHAAYQQRSSQIADLSTFLSTLNNPTVLAGDFNDVPQSYVYQQIDRLLSDSFLAGGGKAFGNTYTRGPLPLRIDYIFHQPELKSYNHQIIREELSDHYPIMIELEK